MAKSLLTASREILKKGRAFADFEGDPQFLSTTWQICRSFVLAIDLGNSTADQIGTATGYNRSTANAYLNALVESGFPISSSIGAKPPFGGRPPRIYKIDPSRIKFMQKRYLKSDYQSAPSATCNYARVGLTYREFELIEQYCIANDISRNALGLLAAERIADRKALGVVRYDSTPRRADKNFVLKIWPSLHGEVSMVVEAANMRLKSKETIGSAIRGEMLELIQPKHLKLVMAKIQDADERVIA